MTVIDKKSEDVLDQFCYTLHTLREKPDLEISGEECRLKNGTIVKLSLELRILKYEDAQEEEEDDDENDSENVDDDLKRQGSSKSANSSKLLFYVFLLINSKHS